jgi:hypothetical protein
MILQTIGRDCLFLNWALPVEALPELVAPLRYDRHRWQGSDHVFVSTALFRQQVLDIPKVPFPRVSYPQLSVRLCTTDGDGVPSFFLCSVLLPAWVLPSVRLVARQQARKARFSYPSQGAQLAIAPLRWRVRSGKTLEVTATAGSGVTGAGPSLGSWQQAVTYFERRKRWYFAAADGLRRIEVSSRDVESVPVTVEVKDDSLLSSCLESGVEGGWPELHSGWLSPEIPLVFEFGWAMESRLPRQVPAPG